jgi:hypothetical protein
VIPTVPGRGNTHAPVTMIGEQRRRPDHDRALGRGRRGAARPLLECVAAARRLPRSRRPGAACRGAAFDRWTRPLIPSCAQDRPSRPPCGRGRCPSSRRRRRRRGPAAGSPVCAAIVLRAAREGLPTIVGRVLDAFADARPRSSRRGG